MYIYINLIWSAREQVEDEYVTVCSIGVDHPHLISEAMIFGSISDRIVRNAKCSILIVKAKESSHK